MMIPNLTTGGKTARMKEICAMDWIQPCDSGVILTIRASPRATRSEVQGLHGNALKVRLKAPPVDGRANEALVEFLAEALDIPAHRITLFAGHTSRSKRVRVAHITAAQVKALLLPDSGNTETRAAFGLHKSGQP